MLAVLESFTESIVEFERLVEGALSNYCSLRDVTAGEVPLKPHYH